jgi:hypothetical protein
MMRSARGDAGIGHGARDVTRRSRAPDECLTGELDLSYAYLILRHSFMVLLIVSALQFSAGGC